MKSHFSAGTLQSIEFFTISISAGSVRFKGELPLSGFVGNECLLRYKGTSK